MKNYFSFLFLLIIGLLLQIFLFKTAPRIECFEIKSQLLKFIQIVFYQFSFLLLFLIVYCKFYLKLPSFKLIQISLLFVVLYAISFALLFYNYSTKCF